MKPISEVIKIYLTALLIATLLAVVTFATILLVGAPSFTCDMFKYNCSEVTRITNVKNNIAKIQFSKQTIKMSEFRLMVVQYVNRISLKYKEHTGEEFTSEEKKDMIDRIISDIIATDTYTIVE